MPHPATVTIVVMGVSGVGKSTVAARLVERLGWAFVEGDDLHPAANRARMAAGLPLDDVDRLPWLQALADWIGRQELAGRDAVLTCSALRRRYRDLLREGHPSVRFVHLVADPQQLDERMRLRTGHFMPATLLNSQLTALEPLEPDEPGATVQSDADLDVTAGVALQALLPGWQDPPS